MKLLLDENLSPKLVEALGEVYAGSSHVHFAGLGGGNDHEVWEFAKQNGFAIVSKDSDFADRSAFYGAPPKVIWLRLGNCTTSDVEHVLGGSAEVIYEFLERDEETCLVIGLA